MRHRDLGSRQFPVKGQVLLLIHWAVEVISLIFGIGLWALGVGRWAFGRSGVQVFSYSRRRVTVALASAGGSVDLGQVEAVERDRWGYRIIEVERFTGKIADSSGQAV